MTTTATVIRVQSPPRRLATTSVTSTMLAVSQNTRSSRTVLRYGAGSSRMRPSRSAPPRFSSESSCARAREKDDTAASTLASTPAARASRTDETTSGTITTCSSARRSVIRAIRLWIPAPLPLQQQPALHAEHLAVLVGRGVVVAEQVQDPVHGEQIDLVGRAVAGRRRLLRRDLGADRDVTEIAGHRVVVGLGGTGGELVHGERQHVGGAGLAHPLLVQHGHRVGVDEPQR